MARHIPLFTSILHFVQALASIPTLAPLLTVPCKFNEPGGIIADLVINLKEIGNAYAACLG